MITQYNSFAELTSSFKDCPDTALFYDAEGTLSSFTYDALYQMILRAQNDIESNEDKSIPDILRTDHSADTVVRIFADVLAGRDLILADGEMPDDILEAVRNQIMQDPSVPGKGAEGRLFFFTSGTTARSRAVILTSRSLLASAASGQAMLPCGKGDTILSILPLSHVFGFVCSMLWGLAYGAAVALGRGVRHIMEDAMYFNPTILPAVPTVIEALHRFHLMNPALSVILIGAAPCQPPLTEALQKEGYRVYLGYGLTETSSGIAITQDLSDPYGLKPCPGADIRIEEDGEISVATPCMMEGYLGEPSPLREGRFYTGDLGSFDENGFLRLSGRKKDMIVTADGTKVFCPEYEAELMSSTGIRELAVAQKGGRPVLVISGDADKSFIADTVDHFNHLRSRSRQIAEIIYLTEPLPRTAVGKIRRWELSQMIGL